MTAERKLIALVSKCPSRLSEIRDQTPEVCKAALLMDGNALQYVRNQTRGLCVLAILTTPDAVQYARERTGRLNALAAGARNERVARDITNGPIIYVRLISETEAVALVERNPGELANIIDPTETVILAAERRRK